MEFLSLKVIFDTSPIITLATLSTAQQNSLERLLPNLEIVLVDTVAQEATANLKYSDAKEIKRLLDLGYLKTVANPQTSQDVLIDGYHKLGQGERDSIRLALTLPNIPLVLDDYLAFVIATRFGLHQTLLLDFIILLTQQKQLSKLDADNLVTQSTTRYSQPFVSHTLEKLKTI